MGNAIDGAGEDAWIVRISDRYPRGRGLNRRSRVVPGQYRDRISEFGELSRHVAADEAATDYENGLPGGHFGLVVSLIGCIHMHVFETSRREFEPRLPTPSGMDWYLDWERYC